VRLERVAIAGLRNNKRIAQAVLTGDLPVGLPAVVDQGPGERDQHPEGVERRLAALGVRTEPGQ
jgi:hypothetical protein